MVVGAKADQVDAANEGKLIHLIGKTTVKGAPTDDVFGVTSPDAVKITREVESFQWVEDTKQTKKTKFGGSEETVTEYSYVKKWDDAVHDSSDFRHPEGHQNPNPQFKGASFQAAEVSLGAFRLPEFLLERWADAKPHPLPDPKTLPEKLSALATVQDGWLVLSATPKTPAVGDARVRFESILAGDTSLLARQVRDTLEEYSTSQGTGIARISSGVKSKEAMFAEAASENALFTWLLRLGGFLAMLAGLALMLNPLKVFADLIPLAGRIVGAGTGLVAFLLSAAGSSTVIALAWLWYRPLLGIALLGVACGGLYLLMKAFRIKAA
jgi:hypothetical protein